MLISILNLTIPFYIGANIEWKYYDYPDLSPINWVIAILSLIHSVYITPFGLWHKFIKQHVKPESEETVSETLVFVYYISLCLLWVFTGYWEAVGN